MERSFDYFKFSKGDQVLLSEPIKGKTFTGGFKEVFKSNSEAYDYLNLPKGTRVTITVTPDDKAVLTPSPGRYTIITQAGVSIMGVPEYVLQHG